MTHKNCTCLNCGEQDIRQIYKDNLGFYCCCAKCGSSFDVDLTEAEEKSFNEVNK